MEIFLLAHDPFSFHTSDAAETGCELMCYLQQGVDECRQTHVSSTAPGTVFGLRNNIIHLPVEVVCQGLHAIHI